MKFGPLSLKWQTILLLIGTLLLSHILALIVYSADRSETLATADTFDLAERIAGYVELAAERSGESRQSVLNTANSRFLVVEPGRSLDEIGCGTFPLESEIDATLKETVPEGISWDSCIIPVRDSVLFSVREAAVESSYRRVLRLGVRFPDGEVIRFEGALKDGQPFLSDSAALYILVSVAMVGTVAYFLIGRITRPLNTFAAKAAEIGRDLDTPPLDEDGPADVGAAARAFNQMQHRLQRLILGRTEMLAAISHDMRTPLARLRLRVEFLADKGERERLLPTLDEMEAMVLSVLQFLRGSAPTEEARDVDIPSLVDSICMDMAATGLPVAFEGLAPALRLRCRPATLRRAVENLIHNAVRYGKLARVSLAHDEREIRICIRDEGPGVPEDCLERIVQPFIRGEESRSRDTGGHGLGLSTALTIAHAHGGDLLLENLPQGGFRASIILPR